MISEFDLNDMVSWESIYFWKGGNCIQECKEQNAVIQNEIRAIIEVQAAYCGCTEEGTITFDWVAVGGDGILKEIVFEAWKNE